MLCLRSRIRLYISTCNEKKKYCREKKKKSEKCAHRINATLYAMLLCIAVFLRFFSSTRHSFIRSILFYLLFISFSLRYEKCLNATYRYILLKFKMKYRSAYANCYKTNNQMMDSYFYSFFFGSHSVSLASHCCWFGRWVSARMQRALFTPLYWRQCVLLAWIRIQSDCKCVLAQFIIPIGPSRSMPNRNV